MESGERRAQSGEESEEWSGEWSGEWRVVSALDGGWMGSGVEK